MAVHWRAGFRRLIRVLTWAYWIIAALIVYNLTTSAMQTYDADTYKYTFHWDRYPAGLHAGGDAIAGAMLGFAVLWAITSGMRWIARGFADGEA